MKPSIWIKMETCFRYKYSSTLLWDLLTFESQAYNVAFVQDIIPI